MKKQTWWTFEIITPFLFLGFALVAGCGKQSQCKGAICGAAAAKQPLSAPTQAPGAPAMTAQDFLTKSGLEDQWFLSDCFPEPQINPYWHKREIEFSGDSAIVTEVQFPDQATCQPESVFPGAASSYPLAQGQLQVNNNTLYMPENGQMSPIQLILSPAGVVLDGVLYH